LNEDSFRTLTEALLASHLEAIDGERAYKIEGAAIARVNVEEALDGKRPWAQVFVGKARRLLTNQLASNQFMNRAFSSLMESDDEAIDTMVRAWWRDDDLDAASSVLDRIVTDPSREDDLRPIRGIGSRAAVLSLFRLVKDPTAYPIFRPGHVRDALDAFGLQQLKASLEGKTAAEVLRSYDAILDEVKESFVSHGLHLQDRLHVQGALWMGKVIADRQRKASGDARPAATPAPANPRSNPEQMGTPQDVASAFPALLDWLRKRGLHYPDGLVAHFVAALMTKPFVVLSGLSGTGKTRLALEIGKCMGAVHVVPVKPDWTDTRGVLGYVNPLTGRYETTPALEAALGALDTDSPTMLVLDEMNLAHVERYFADVLSAMESGEAIPLHDSDEVEGQGIPKRLTWPRNLFLVGTVNADETTYPFSPKVLDRAFVIDMSRVDLHGYLGTGTYGQDEAAPVLPAFAPNRDWRSLRLDEDDFEFIRALHAALEQAGRPFGYRTVDEGLAFLAHARAFGRFDLDARDALLVSKILPRLHGRRHEIEPVLEALAGIAGVDLDDWEEGSESGRFPRTRALLRRMHQQVVGEGHLSSLVG